jgi:tetratricopeptide (TPR) repeat protein
MEYLDKVSSSSASAVGASVNALKGYMAIKEGTYREAIQNLSSAGNNAMVVFNRALAYLLQASLTMDEDGYRRAMSQFEEAIAADGNNAYAYYGAAITAARLQDVNKLVEHLKKAASMNSELKSRAVTDLEFINYFDNADFKGAL